MADQINTEHRYSQWELWFAEWELILPQDARESFRALLSASQPVAGLGHPCTQKLSGNRSMDVLRAAMNDAGLVGDKRYELVGFFCNRWNEAVAWDVAALSQPSAGTAGVAEQHGSRTE